MLKYYMRYSVKVVPRSSRCKVEEMGHGELKVKLTAPPVDGKANEQLIEVLAKHFEVKRAKVEIVAGAGASRKIVKIK